MNDPMEMLWIALHDEVYTDKDGRFICATDGDCNLAVAIVAEHNEVIKNKQS